MLTILGVALIAFGRRNFSKRAGWWSAAILLGNPLVIWAGTVAYLDICLMLFSTMAALTFWNWLNSRQHYWFTLSGAFCGFAASTKYPALVSMPWHLAFNQDVFLSELHHLSKLYFFALLIIVLFSFKNGSIRKIVGFAVAFLVFWSFSAQVLRFLFSAVPIMSVAVAASLDMLLAWIPFTSKWRCHWIVVAILKTHLVLSLTRY